MHEDWAEDALWRGVRDRNPRALEALITRYSREVTYFVRVVLDGIGTLQDAEECANDLFIAVWEEISSFDPARGTLRTWLTMRAKYLALDRRRQIQRRQIITGVNATQVSAREREDERAPADVIAESHDPGESLDHLLERRERHAQLRRALEELPELDRLLVYLRYFRLDPTEDIAARTGLTRRAIDTRLWRARRMLREAMEAEERHALEGARGSMSTSVSSAGGGASSRVSLATPRGR
ncbi:MAG: sigma-70 family RNA polymerase sigma factor [Ktedonobacterales bacterium]